MEQTSGTAAAGVDGRECCAPFPIAVMDGEGAGMMADDLQLLAHPVRLQILDLLARHDGEVCVCDLSAALPIKQPTVSHHLRLLRAGGLVTDERRGQWIYYRVDAGRLTRLQEQFSGLLGKMKEACCG